MNSESPPQRDNASGLDQCIETLRFLHATELVRSGKYLEAEATLSPKGMVPETARELDLLARINAHQERFEEAARYWQAALKKEPGNSSYETCLEQLSDIQDGKGLSDGESNTAFRVSIGVCVIVLIFGLLYWSHRTTPVPVKGTLIEDKAAQSAPNSPSNIVVPPAATDTSTAFNNHQFQEAIEQLQQSQKSQIQTIIGQIAAIQTNQAVLLDGQNASRMQATALGESIAELKRQQAEAQHAIELTRSELLILTTAKAPATAAPELAPTHLPNPSDFNPGTPGVTISAQNNNWVISFDSGLFDRDEHFKIGAKARLESVAKALVQTQAKFTIHIIGLAEDEHPTWPWSSAQSYEELGLSRAKSVLIYLRGLEIFPTNKLSAGSGAATQRPFTSPNINNRSVVLEIAPD